MTSTQAHHAFDRAIESERQWAREAYAARSSHDYDRAMARRWRYVDQATVAAGQHAPATCAECQKFHLGASRG